MFGLFLVYMMSCVRIYKVATLALIFGRPHHLTDEYNVSADSSTRVHFVENFSVHPPATLQFIIGRLSTYGDKL